MLPEVEHEITKTIASKTTATKTVGAGTKAVAAGLDKEALHEIITAKTAKGSIVAGATKGASAKSAGASLIPTDPISTAGTIWTGKGMSLGLGLGLGPIGPILLAGIIGVVGYQYWKYRNKHITDEGFMYEGFMDDIHDKK